MEGAMFDLRGLIAPFRRDKKRDFASGSGPDLLRAKVLQALLTEGAGPRSSGELPWRTSFGAGLHLLRHQQRQRHQQKPNLKIKNIGVMLLNIIQVIQIQNGNLLNKILLKLIITFMTILN